MRALFVIIVSAVGIVAGSAAASAADFRFSTYDDIVVGPNAIPQVVYQYQPGAAMRAYWLPLSRNRYYFQRTGKRPAIGRYERLSKRHRPTRLATGYERYWSNAAAIPRNCGWLSARDQQLISDRHCYRFPSAPRTSKP